MGRNLGLLALLFGLSACSGTTALGTGGSGTTSTGTGTSTGTTTGGTTTNTADNSVTLTMDSFTVPSGAEVYYCQNFLNPFGGVDANVQTFESHMSPGSHHLLLFYKDDITENGALETCSGLEFAATPYGAQVPDDAQSFPEGVAALVPGKMGLRLQAHYLNTTGSPIQAHIEMKFRLAEPGSVKFQAGVMFVVDTEFLVQPTSSAVVSQDCTLPQDMNILRVSSHMHRHGTHFESTVAGKPLYQTKVWSEPVPAFFEPAMAVHEGDPLHYSCAFTNTSSDPLTFGESAATNEMCILIASFYPAPPGQATIAASHCKSKQE